jgi:hypothetical protein
VVVAALASSETVQEKVVVAVLASYSSGVLKIGKKDLLAPALKDHLDLLGLVRSHQD